MPRQQPATSAATAAKAAGVSIDDALVLQVAHLDLLLAAADGRVDLNALAREALASQGLGRRGKWVGFDAAAKEWGVS
jgi:hypothetical protein